MSDTSTTGMTMFSLADTTCSLCGAAVRAGEVWTAYGPDPVLDATAHHANCADVYLDRVPAPEDLRIALSRLDGSNKSAVSLLTGMSADRLDELGGISN